MPICVYICDNTGLALYMLHLILLHRITSVDPTFTKSVSKVGALAQKCSACYPWLGRWQDPQWVEVYKKSGHDHTGKYF